MSAPFNWTGINWRSDAVADAMLRLMAALEEQDAAFKGISITVDVPKRTAPEKYIGTFFGTVRVNEREV
jgi:hypothetical protein